MFDIGGSIWGGGKKERRAGAGASDWWKILPSMKFGKYLTKMIGRGATPYGGEFVAEMFPGQEESRGIARGTLQELATVDPERIQKRWEMFGKPAVREAYGGPGGYYSSERMLGESRAAQEYQIQEEERAADVAGRLSAFETEGLGGLARRIEQQKLTAAFDEFLRTQPEYSPWLQILLGFLGTPTLVDYGRQWGKSFEMYGKGQASGGM